MAKFLSCNTVNLSCENIAKLLPASSSASAATYPEMTTWPTNTKNALHLKKPKENLLMVW